MTTTPDPIHGELGVLRDDGEKVQCHVCGEWFGHLGGHAAHAHGLGADEYRRRFGLMRKTKLGGPAWLAMRRQIGADHLKAAPNPRRERVKSMSTEERRAEQSNRAWRAEHERTKTPPDRTRARPRSQVRDRNGPPRCVHPARCHQVR